MTYDEETREVLLAATQVTTRLVALSMEAHEDSASAVLRELSPEMRTLVTIRLVGIASHFVDEYARAVGRSPEECLAEITDAFIEDLMS